MKQVNSAGLCQAFAIILKSLNLVSLNLQNLSNLNCKNGVFKSGFRRGIMVRKFINDPYFTLQNSFQKYNRSIRGSVSFVVFYGFCSGYDCLVLKKL